MSALLNVEEDPELSARWVQALDSVRSVRANIGAPFKSAVKNAVAITTNDFVKSYLKKSMRTWRNNSAGLTKRAIIWLVDKVNSLNRCEPVRSTVPFIVFSPFWSFIRAGSRS